MEVPEEVTQSKDIAVITDQEKAAWEVQKDHLVNLKFHETLRMSEEDYRASLPDFQPQPEQFKGRFHRPLLIDPRVRLDVQFKLYRAEGYSDFQKKQSKMQSHELQDRSEPYQIWVSEGLELQGLSENEAISKFAPDERGLTIIEGLALVREDPSILDDHTLDLSGSQIVIEVPGGTITHAPRFRKIPSWHYQVALRMANAYTRNSPKAIFPTCGVLSAA